MKTQSHRVVRCDRKQTASNLTGIGDLQFFQASLWLTLLSLSGCWSSGGVLISPEIDPIAATNKAFELYDTDGDGYLDSVELGAVPGIKNHMDLYDTANDARVSKSEMQNRITEWKSGPAMLTHSCRVTLDGRPLAGAEVRYEPEEYLKDWLHPASGVTDESGLASIGVPVELLPSSHQRLTALYAGTYKIKITHPSTLIPERYNSKTTLGHEVSRGPSESPVQELSLKSK